MLSKLFQMNKNTMKYILHLIYEQYSKSANKNQEKVLLGKTMKGFLEFFSKTKKSPRANGFDIWF